MAISTDLKNVTDSSRRSYERTLRSQSSRGFAFLIEAVVVLAFLMGCLAVFVKLFSSAQLEGLAANRLSQAVVAATNKAEEFSADPTNADGTVTEDGLRIDCEVTEDATEAGTHFFATISVFDEHDADREVFTLETSRYVSGHPKGDAS